MHLIGCPPAVDITPRHFPNVVYISAIERRQSAEPRVVVSALFYFMKYENLFT